MLLADGRDHWWVVTPESDTDAMAAELSSIWREHVSPWLEKVKTISGAAQELETSILVNPLAAVAARLVLGERGQAAQLLDAVIKRSEANKYPDPANAALRASHLKEFRKWGVTHGLLAPEEMTHP
jgi:hypothetical protein